MLKTLSAKPEIESVDMERFQVYSRVEILAVLRAIHAQRVLMTLYFNHGDEFILTTLLSVNPEFEEMVFDAGPDKQLNKRLTDSQRIIGVAFVDSVKVQFNATRAESTTFEGSPAFRLRLPDSVLRLQRRNYFRIPTPIAKPLKCTVARPVPPEPVAPDAAAKPKVVELTVVEIGCGGLALTMNPDELRIEPGTSLEQFTLELPAQAGMPVRGHACGNGHAGAALRQQGRSRSQNTLAGNREKGIPAIDPASGRDDGPWQCGQICMFMMSW
jgi:flagellar brake protein